MSYRASVNQITEWLKTNKVRTLSDLCRIERSIVDLKSEEEKQATMGLMISAWDSYMDSNQLLVELRGLTRNYPVSVSLLEEARRSVSDDPESVRSWNLVWLCLIKIRDEGLVLTCAQAEALKPAMWGGRYPSADEAEQLTRCFVYEWSHAVATLLRHWHRDPVWY